MAALRALVQGRAGPEGLHHRLSAAVAASAQSHRWQDAADHRLALLRADRRNMRAEPLAASV